MKTSILLLIVAMFGQSAVNHQASDQHHNEKTITMTSEKNKEIVRAMYEQCLNERKFTQLSNFIHEDYAGPLGEKGPAGFEQTIKGIITGFPDIQWRVDDIFAEGNKVAIRWSWEGTHKGTFRTFSPTGKRITNKAIVIYEFRGEKIASVWMESDRLGFFQQMGSVPEK